LMMNPVPWLQMTNMISYQGLVRTFPKLRNFNLSVLFKFHLFKKIAYGGVVKLVSLRCAAAEC
ncbi:hypothetical protein ACK3YT_20580, partial [Aeromonas caviae]